ncbi:MAG: hypothetical protein Q4B47_03460 [Eubacteriales bacterium]|nr:hypothetical protein [Eubacteriales bacterium]
MNFKKSLAFITAASMTISGTAMTSTCFANEDAASEYHTMAETALDNSLESFEKNYERALSRFSDLTENGKHADITVELGEGATALIKALGIDTSWLQNVSLTIDEKLSSEAFSVVLGVSLNDHSLFTVNMPIDFANMLSYIQIPEVSDSYISFPASANINGTPITLQELISNMESLLPDTGTLTSLISRYGKLIINGMTNISGETKSMFEGDYKQDCSVYTITVSQKDVQAIAKEVLTTAQQDEELKTVLVQLVDALPSELNANGEQTYQSMQDSIKQTLSDLDQADNATDDTMAVLEVAFDTDQKLVGANIYVEGMEQPVFSYENSKNGDNFHSNIQITSDDNKIVSVIGEGTTTDGITNGNYQLLLNNGEQDLTLLNVDVADYYNDPDAQKGHSEFTLKLGENINDVISHSENQNISGATMAANLLSAYSLVLTEDITPDSVDTAITVVNGEQTFGTLRQHVVSSVEKEAALPAASDEVIDSNDKEKMNEYINSITPDMVYNILKDTGVPEEYLAILQDTATE